MTFTRVLTFGLLTTVSSLQQWGVPKFVVRPLVRTVVEVAAENPKLMPIAHVALDFIEGKPLPRVSSLVEDAKPEAGGAGFVGGAASVQPRGAGEPVQPPVSSTAKKNAVLELLEFVFTKVAAIIVTYTELAYLESVLYVQKSIDRTIYRIRAAPGDASNAAKVAVQRAIARIRAAPADAVAATNAEYRRRTDEVRLKAEAKIADVRAQVEEVKTGVEQAPARARKAVNTATAALIAAVPGLANARDSWPPQQ